jgi:phage terminase Nu1 subunit (DNA packaging protein)
MVEISKPRIAGEWPKAVVSQSKLASFLNLSPGRIRQMEHERSIPPEARIARGQYDLQIAVLGVLRHKERQLVEVRAGILDGGLERARLVRAQADLAEKELAIKSGKLVDAEKVGDVCDQFVAAVATRIFAVPDKIAQHIVAIRIPMDAANLLRKELEEALASLVGLKFVPGTHGPPRVK